MRSDGIEVQVGSFDNSNGTCNTSEELSKTTMAIPIWSGMDEHEIETVISKILKGVETYDNIK